MHTPKRLGILTSGGDCPGLNAAIRAVVSHATLTYGWEVLGIPYATEGLLERKAVALNVHGLDMRGIDPMLSTGGTILGSINRGPTEAHAADIIAGYHALELDALIAIGGDGSLAILSQLARQGNWNLVGIPKTIDNDVALTECSIGFDTAVNTLVDALHKLSYTAASHDRVMVLETMGRTAGHLALRGGIAGGADVILMPEIPYSIEAVCRQISELRDRWGHKFAIVLVAEGAKTLSGESREYRDAQGEIRLRGIGEYVTDEICRCTNNGIEARVSVLGHVQRGGIPSAFDRVLASVLGKGAVDLVAQDQFAQMVVWQNGGVRSVSLGEVCARSPRLVTPEGDLVQTARALGIYVGELDVPAKVGSEDVLTH
ncbi:ATP-dependent 6-phosphofructokinase [Phormidium yuhuli AB48]|uniref:ATP-dependent 6-phosphofructokinase n=1 Tax=Phormidium yuhuli AB48 TaxID=2940671 RepID=A0ABY5AR38_9CYAN|nr:ATP-dependent 6-phosphofructokinase [Phormidium yuhuli]USR91236.1 ATP-dependent 6-phosphofructokinase [Phormidium yuhuli AB48]